MKWIVLLLLVGGIAYGVIFHKDDLMGLIGKKTSTGESQDSPDKSPKKETSTASKTEKTKDKPAPKPKKEEIDPDILEEYPMPDFKSIEELTGNWETVPGSAFPRTVTLLSDVEIEIAIGAGTGRSKIPAGNTISALALANGELTFSRTAGGSLKSKTDVENTDFKKVLNDIYEGWKKRKVNKVLQDRKIAMRERASEVAKNTAAETGVVSVAGDPENIDPVVGPKPTRGSDGKIAAMVKSLQDRDVNEIKLDEIDSWGGIRYEIVEGEPYWTGTVRYRTATLFGEIDTEAMALIRNNKVIDWIYTGSGEEVP